MPNFSVIISVYNKELHIANTINSVLNQTIQDFEIIVINDGSTDNSKIILESFHDKRISIFHTKNKGASAARNHGIQQANSDYIALLDGDDYWHPFFLEEINSLLAKFPKEKIFATAIELQDNNLIYPAKYSIPSNTQHQIIDYFKGSQLKTVLSSSSVVVHQSVFKNIGYFDPTIISGQDTDLWIRIGIKYQIAFSRRVAVRYINVTNSLSNTTIDVTKKSDFKKFEEAEKTNPDLKKILDLNRFSMAILSKRGKNNEKFEFYKSGINYKNLNWKQKILLKLPKPLLDFLVNFKHFLKRNKIILRILD